MLTPGTIREQYSLGHTIMGGPCTCTYCQLIEYAESDLVSSAIAGADDDRDVYYQVQAEAATRTLDRLLLGPQKRARSRLGRLLDFLDKP
jgi:hypothetical protein